MTGVDSSTCPHGMGPLLQIPASSALTPLCSGLLNHTSSSDKTYTTSAQYVTIGVTNCLSAPVTQKSEHTATITKIRVHCLRFAMWCVSHSQKQMYFIQAHARTCNAQDAPIHTPLPEDNRSSVCWNTNMCVWVYKHVCFPSPLRFVCSICSLKS